MSRAVVLHLCDSPFVGGPEKQILGQCRHIDPSRFELCVGSFTPNACADNQFLRAARALGSQTFRLTDGKLAFPLAVGQLCSVVRRRRASLIVSHGYRADFVSASASLLTGVPFVAYFHGRTGVDARVRLYESLDVRVMRRARRVVCVCYNAAAALHKRGVRRVEVIPNAIDVAAAVALGTREESRGALGLGHGEIAVGTVGRISIEKGHIHLVDAAPGVLARCPCARFIMVGDGPLRERLVRRAVELGVGDRFVFTGFREHSVVLMKAFDVFVLPSLSENMPVSLLEAMACGIDVVATDVGGVREVLAPASVEPVPPGSPRALAAAILAAIERKGLPGGYGDSLRRRAAEFSFRRQSVAIEALISGCLESKEGK